MHVIFRYKYCPVHSKLSWKINCLGWSCKERQRDGEEKTDQFYHQKVLTFLNKKNVIFLFFLPYFLSNPDFLTLFYTFSVLTWMYEFRLPHTFIKPSANICKYVTFSTKKIWWKASVVQVISLYQMTFWCRALQQAAYRPVIANTCKSWNSIAAWSFYQGTQRKLNCWHTTSKEFLFSSCFWEYKIGCVLPKKSYKGSTLCKEDVILGYKDLKYTKLSTFQTS